VDHRILIGVSACLLGQKVRYDGGHKRDPFIADILSARFAFVPVCPEAGCGLGVPREPMVLWGDPDRPRLRTRDTGRDVTEQLLSWTRRRLEELACQDLGGFIVKSGSPSCGLAGVPVHAGAGMPGGTGRGLFVAAFLERFPWIPVEDEARLARADIRESFVERAVGCRL